MLVAILIAQGLVFLWWAFEAFRALFDIAARARVETGQPIAGPITFLRIAGQWLRDPATRSYRLRLLVLTVIMMALSVAAAVTGPAPL